MHKLDLGPLTVYFHRTVRVDPERTSNLPPSLGHFEIYKVSDYKDQCPDYWEPEGYFLAMHDKEAMWLSLSCPEPVALLVGAGGINAVTGEKLGIELAKDNYLVTPPQPWLDGWKNEDGSVSQFVTTPYQKGDGLTIGEQIMGKECRTGGMGLAVYTAKDREDIKKKAFPSETHGDDPYGKLLGSPKKPICLDPESFCPNGYHSEHLELCSLHDEDYWVPIKQTDGIPSITIGPNDLSFMPEQTKTSSLDFKAATTPRKLSRGASGQSVKRIACSEIGVGKGGKITQKIYPDPYGLEVWKESPDCTTAIYLIDGPSFTQITGKAMPPIPKHVNEYAGKWFGLQDKEEKDVPGTDKFVGLKTAFSEKEKKE